MESIVITWRELLFVVAIILAVYIAEMLLLMRAGGELRKPRWLKGPHEKRGEQELRRELDEIRTRLALLESRQSSQPVEAEEAPQEDESTQYRRAIRLARQGRDAEAISASCRLSRGEAELIVSMHGGREV